MQVHMSHVCMWGSLIHAHTLLNEAYSNTQYVYIYIPGKSWFWAKNFTPPKFKDMYICIIQSTYIHVCMHIKVLLYGWQCYIHWVLLFIHMVCEGMYIVNGWGSVWCCSISVITNYNVETTISVCLHVCWYLLCVHIAQTVCTYSCIAKSVYLYIINVWNA